MTMAPMRWSLILVSALAVFGPHCSEGTPEQSLEAPRCCCGESHLILRGSFMGRLCKDFCHGTKQGFCPALVQDYVTSCISDSTLRLNGGFDGGSSKAGMEGAGVMIDRLSESRTERGLLQQNSRILMTPKHDHLSYYGFMWDVRAIRRRVRITGIHAAGTSSKGPFNYRIYAAMQPFEMISGMKEHWVEVGAGKLQLPDEVGTFAPLPLNQEIVIEADHTRALYLHCDNAEGVAYRYDVDAEDNVTDRDDDIEILAGIAGFSLVPFEDMYDLPRTFAGSIEYVV